MRKIVLLFMVTASLGIALMCCTNPSHRAEELINKTIEAHGGDLYRQATIEFYFRGTHYIAKRDKNSFSYERVQQDSIHTIHDFVDNDGYRREVDGVIVNMPDSIQDKYAASTNSVIYFALLPYGLNDKAVIKKWIGETSLEDQKYYTIEVRFKQDGGGEDFDDVYLYWIHQQKFTIDYLAYSFQEDNRAGLRFRKGYNARVVEGIRFQDYINYKIDDVTASIRDLEQLFKEDKLEELSRIKLDRITVL